MEKGEEEKRCIRRRKKKSIKEDDKEEKKKIAKMMTYVVKDTHGAANSYNRVEKSLHVYMYMYRNTVIKSCSYEHTYSVIKGMLRRVNMFSPHSNGI